MEKTEKISVHIKYKDIEKEFVTYLEDAWILLRQFFNEHIPSFEIANRLWLNIDLQQLAKDCDGLIAFTKDGPSILVPNKRLTDNETLLLWLLASHLGYELGVLATEATTKTDLKLRLGKSAKIASTRLGELVKNGSIAKTKDEKYRITVLGAIQVQREVIPKIKGKLNV